MISKQPGIAETGASQSKHHEHLLNECADCFKQAMYITITKMSKDEYNSPHRQGMQAVRRKGVSLFIWAVSKKSFVKYLAVSEW